MVWNDFSKDDGNDSNKTPYDLRQIYAKLVGEHMNLIALHRINRNFIEWFRALENLYTLTGFKYDPDEVDKPTYKSMRVKVVNLSNEYTDTWQKPREGNEVDVEKIDTALRDLEFFIYSKMQECGIFGKGYEYDEDEI